MLIDVQKIADNQTLSRGQVFIGASGTDPVTAPVSVFKDAAFTESISTPLTVDADGMSQDSNGCRINIYSNFNYTIQLKDRYGADFYKDIPEITV